jgi:hypothetical protein
MNFGIIQQNSLIISYLTMYFSKMLYNLYSKVSDSGFHSDNIILVKIHCTFFHSVPKLYQYRIHDLIKLLL